MLTHSSSRPDSLPDGPCDPGNPSAETQSGGRADSQGRMDQAFSPSIGMKDEEWVSSQVTGWANAKALCWHQPQEPCAGWRRCRLVGKDCSDTLMTDSSERRAARTMLQKIPVPTPFRRPSCTTNLDQA